MGIISRSLINAFADVVEFSEAATRTNRVPTLVTEELAKQRRMTNEVFDSLYDRFQRKCGQHGVGENEVALDLSEIDRRAKNRKIAVERRQARVLKGEAAFIAG